MTNETVMKFKELFEKQKKDLVYTASVMNQEFCLKEEDRIDEADLTSSELEQQMRMRLRNREALFLKKIDEALERIAEGTFGECGDCGDDIEMKRLEARPTATLCVLCKEGEERREKLHIDGHRHKSIGKVLSFRIVS